MRLVINVEIERLNLSTHEGLHTGNLDVLVGRVLRMHAALNNTVRDVVLREALGCLVAKRDAIRYEYTASLVLTSLIQHGGSNLGFSKGAKRGEKDAPMPCAECGG